MELENEIHELLNDVDIEITQNTDTQTTHGYAVYHLSDGGHILLANGVRQQDDGGMYDAPRESELLEDELKEKAYNQLFDFLKFHLDRLSV